MKETIRQFGGAIIAMTAVLIVLGLVFGMIYVSKNNSKVGIMAGISDAFETGQEKEVVINRDFDTDKSINDIGFNEILLGEEYNIKDLIYVSNNSSYEVYLIEASFGGEDVLDKVYNKNSQTFRVDEAGVYNLRFKIILDNGYSEYTYRTVCIN